MSKRWPHRLLELRFEEALRTVDAQETRIRELEAANAKLAEACRAVMREHSDVYDRLLDRYHTCSCDVCQQAQAAIDTATREAR